MQMTDRSIGHPVATGARATPARSRMPVLFLGGMKGVEMLSNVQIRFIERLREAARDHGVVSDLLSTLEECLYIEDGMNIATVGDKEDLEWLEAALVAAKFVEYDRSGSKGGSEQDQEE